jgi:eukaryotic-like serine/threonine-protein kinase
MIGQTLAHYEILEELGHGGMGVVYKARDTHLDRYVAIKVLPAEAVVNPERKRRFVQEAKAASALNHPNIVTIFDISSDSGTDFIAMEYVPGKPLDELIPRKGMPLGELLKISVQVADALTAAHAAGIIHRDLKPANIMVGDDGRVRVLDFGLAKLTDPSESSELDETKTVAVAESSPKTEEGTILGTASYMSPEQAEGRKVDARSDIFSFGSVLYEMTTGRRPFVGESNMATLAAIISQEPGQLSEEIPHDLDKAITRCLRKDLSRRFQHMDDVKIALEELKEESDSGKLVSASTSDSEIRRQAVKLPMVAVAIIITAVVAVWLWKGRSGPIEPEVPLVAVRLTSYPGQEYAPSFSPDGSQVAFLWNRGGNPDIYIKQIGIDTPERVTEHPAWDGSPVWSPDGQLIAFRRVDSSRNKVGILVKPQRGGTERLLREFENSEWSNPAGPDHCWTRDSRWLVAVGRDSPEEKFGLVLISLETSEMRRLTVPPEGFEADGGPALSPDGRTLAFTRHVDGARSDLYMFGLSGELRPEGEPQRITFENRRSFAPAWTADGRDIIYCSGSLYGDTSLWRIAPFESQSARQLSFAGEGANHPAISQQGNRLAFSIWSYGSDIWRVVVPDGGRQASKPVKLVSSTRREADAEYSPDGQRIAFVSNRSGSYEIWVCASDGSNSVRLTALGGYARAPRWSPDGEKIAFFSSAEGNREIYVIAANGGAPMRLTDHPAEDSDPAWAQDGRWIYFHSSRTEESQVWKMPADGGEAVQMTNKGGEVPLESDDGRFLFYSKQLPDTTTYSLWRVSTDGGEEVQVLDSLRFKTTFDLVEQGIYFIPKPEADGRHLVQFQQFASGAIRTIAEIDPPLAEGLTISPDLRTILYVKRTEVSSDLMLVENFR